MKRNLRSRNICSNLRILCLSCHCLDKHQCKPTLLLRNHNLYLDHSVSQYLKILHDNPSLRKILHYHHLFRCFPNEHVIQHDYNVLHLLNFRPRHRAEYVHQKFHCSLATIHHSNHHYHLHKFHLQHQMNLQNFQFDYHRNQSVLLC